MKKDYINLDLKSNHDGLSALQAQVASMWESSRWKRVAMEKDAQDNYKYLRRKLPGSVDGICIEYIEPVCKDAVDSVIPSLQNIFCNNDTMAVKFRPIDTFSLTGAKMSDIAAAVNKEMNKQWLIENNGYEQSYDIFTEVLTVGNVFAKVSIEEEVITLPIKPMDTELPVDVLEAMLVEYPDTESLEKKIEINEELGTFKIVKGFDLTKVEESEVIKFVSWGEMYVDSVCTDIAEARYVCHRILTTRGEMLKQFPESEEKVERATTINGLGETETSNINLEDQGTLTSKEDWYNQNIDDQEGLVYLYETYMRSSLLEDGKESKFYQIYTVDADATEILRVCEVDGHPFIMGEANPIPDSLRGASLVGDLAPEQDLQSVITQIIVRDSANEAYHRYLAVKGAYDRKSLLDNRPGGVVEIEQPGAISLMPYHGLPQSISTLQQRVDANVNEQKGNALGMGLGDSMNNVAASTMAMAVQNEEMKDKRIAKALAYSFFRPMFEKMYMQMQREGFSLTLEDGTKIKGTDLPKRCEFTIDVNTANDNARESGQLIQMVTQATQLAQAPNKLIDLQGMYNAFEDISKATGSLDVSRYFRNPEDHPPTDQQMLDAKLGKAAQDEMTKLDIELKQLAVQKLAIDIVEVQHDIERAKEKNSIDYIEAQSDVAKNATAGEAETIKTETQAFVKMQEIESSERIAQADVALTQSTGKDVDISH